MIDLTDFEVSSFFEPGYNIHIILLRNAEGFLCGWGIGKNEQDAKDNIEMKNIHEGSSFKSWLEEEGLALELSDSDKKKTVDTVLDNTSFVKNLIKKVDKKFNSVSDMVKLDVENGVCAYELLLKSVYVGWYTDDKNLLNHAQASLNEIHEKYSSLITVLLECIK
jgi:hypothetical protein